MKKLLLALLFLPFISFSQDIPGEGLIVAEFNAPFSNTKCEYLDKLDDCDIVKIDISKNTAFRKSSGKVLWSLWITVLGILGKIIFWD